MNLKCKCGYTSKEDWRVIRHIDRSIDDPTHKVKLNVSREVMDALEKLVQKGFEQKRHPD